MSTMLIYLLIFIFMVVSFSLNKIPMSVTSMICLLLLVLTGCIDATTALSNFSSSTVITMVSMFIVAAGLNRTQMINHISKLVYRVTKGSFTKVLAGYVLVTFFLGQFIPSIVALFALVCPLVIHMCEEMDISPSKMVYSIGLTAVSASFAIMPIGPYAASFIEDNGYLASYSYDMYQFTIWSETFVKLPVAIFVVIWAIFVAPKFAPDKPDLPIKMLEKRELAKRDPLNPVQEVIGYGVFIVVILGLMFQSKIGLASWIIPMAGAVIIVASGVLKEKEAIASMNMDIILLYVGVVTLGNAFANTGAGELVGDFVANLLGNTTNSYLIGAIFYFAAFFLTSVLYNRAVSKILLPLAILTSISLGCDPRGVIIMCYVGSMSSIITPMATAVVPMMMGAGGYSQKTLVKMGALPALLMGVIAVAIGMTIFPAYPSM